jgi:cystathionine beta-lyase/cystathionine gamma-synthase
MVGILWPAQVKLPVPPFSMTHADVPDDVRVRLSVGIENADDLIADLNQALAEV